MKKNLKALVASDDRMIRLPLTNKLGQAGFEVEEVNIGKAVIT